MKAIFVTEYLFCRCKSSLVVLTHRHENHPMLQHRETPNSQDSFVAGDSIFRDFLARKPIHRTSVTLWLCKYLGKYRGQLTRRHQTDLPHLKTYTHVLAGRDTKPTGLQVELGEAS